MHYYLYEIINNVNGKIYIGVHKTKNLDDGYFGSGKILKYAIKKYGIENFTKNILEIFDTQEDMFCREQEIVNTEFVSRQDTYNLKLGGVGGFDYINSIITTETRIKHGKIGRQVVEDNGNLHKIYSPESHQKSLETQRINKLGFFDPFNNKRFRDLAATPKAVEKRKLTMALNGHSVGENNSQYGTMWITNGDIDKKIKKDSQIPLGWYKGRTQKSQLGV